MPHIDQPGRGTGESFDAQNSMVEDFHSVMSEDPSTVVKQIDNFRGSTDTTSLQGFPSAENLMDSSSLGSKPILENVKHCNDGIQSQQSENILPSSREAQPDGNERVTDADTSFTVEIDEGVRVLPSDYILPSSREAQPDGNERVTDADTDTSFTVEIEEGVRVLPSDMSSSVNKGGTRARNSTEVEIGDTTASVDNNQTININIDLPDIHNNQDLESGENRFRNRDRIHHERNSSHQRRQRFDRDGSRADRVDGRRDLRNGDDSCSHDEPIYTIPPFPPGYEQNRPPIFLDPGRLTDARQLPIDEGTKDLFDSGIDTGDLDLARPGAERGITFNIINITPSELPNTFSNCLNSGFDSNFSPVPQSTDSLLRNLQGLFRPTDARFALPRSHNPVDFISNLSDIVNGGSSNSGGLPSPGDFLQNLQRSLLPPGMDRLLPQPPRPETFLRDLTEMVGYTGDNQSIFPQLPRPDQFLTGLGRSLGFDSSPLGNSQAYRTLDCRHAMHGTRDFVPNFNGSPFDSPINFRPGDPMNRISDILPNIPGLDNLPNPTSFAGSGVFDRFAGNFDLTMPPGGGFIPDIFSGDNIIPMPFSGDFNLPNPFSGNGAISLPFMSDSFLPIPAGNGNMIPTPFSGGLDVASLIPGNGTIPSPFDGLRTGLDIHNNLTRSQFDLARNGAQLGLEVGTIPLDLAEGAIDIHTDIARAPLKLAENIVGKDTPAAIPIQLADKAIDLHEDIHKAPINLAKKAKDFFKKLF